MTRYQPKTNRDIEENAEESIFDNPEEAAEDAYPENGEPAADTAESAELRDSEETENAEDEYDEFGEEYDSEEEDEAAVPVKKKKRKKWPIVMACVCGGIIIIIIALLVAFHLITGGFKATELDRDELGIVETTTAESTNKVTKITNIAFFGIDTRDFLPEIGDQYRSDSIIIMSINPMNNTVKMTSILRDSKVPIEGHDATKINAAYQYGGPTLAIKTLNTNFQLDIEDYVTVDFGELEQVIDIVGGIDIEITWGEAEMINFYAATEMKYEGEGVVEGMAHLNGAQAVSYSRIRNLDTDVYRAGRQQTVLTAVFNKVKTMSVSEYPSMIRQFLECVETSLSYSDILTLATSVDIKSADLIKNTIPDVNYQPNIWGGIDEDTGAWVWVYDLDFAAERLHTIIYGTEGNGEGETEVETCDPNSSDITY